MRHFFRLTAALLCCSLLLGTAVQATAIPEPAHYAAITFDDGPSGPITQALLRGLAQRQVKATFFLCGYRLETYPGLAAQIAGDGHEIGSHGYSHKPLSDMSAAEVRQELARTNQLLRAQIGHAPTVCRPPGGQCSDTVRRIARQMHLPLILWSVDPRDWCCHNECQVCARITSNAQNGAIILLHDMSSCSVAAALRAIDTMQEQGYEFVTVSQLAALTGHQLVPGELYYSFPPQAQDAGAAK